MDLYCWEYARGLVCRYRNLVQLLAFPPGSSLWSSIFEAKWSFSAGTYSLRLPVRWELALWPPGPGRPSCLYRHIYTLLYSFAGIKIDRVEGFPLALDLKIHLVANHAYSQEKNTNNKIITFHNEWLAHQKKNDQLSRRFSTLRS